MDSQNQTILDFLSKQRVCSLSTLLKDGSPHASALHYSHRDEPLTLYFSIENTSKKCENLLDGKISRASAVVGFSEEEWITLQMDGEVKAILSEEELKRAKSTHYPKHPDSQQYEHDLETLFLAFTPSWWRYTDYNTDPPTIYCSQDNK